MNLITITYKEYISMAPAKGQHILAQQTETAIIVYQAYTPTIADYAVAQQQLGGPAFSFNRMTWIKPNFLWMMYRCGWAAKQNQERVLAITISKGFFDRILSEAEYAAFSSTVYPDRETWQTKMDDSEVRLQWDPDHDPHGNKQERRAIQLGMKGKIMEQYAAKEIIKIEDVTEFAKEQYQFVRQNDFGNLMVPIERKYLPESESLRRKLQLDE